jgi:hypothetical protein
VYSADAPLFMDRLPPTAGGCFSSTSVELAALVLLEPHQGSKTAIRVMRTIDVDPEQFSPTF